MKIAIGISTLNNGINQVWEKIKNIPDEFLIIISHQVTDKQKQHGDICKKNNVIIITTYCKGLSKSRNILLATAFQKSVDYMIISDDDVAYLVNGLYELKDRIIEDRGKYHYQIQSCTQDGRLRKKYPLMRKRLNRLSAFNISSIEMCLNVNQIQECNVWFDECFGLGARYKAGEEPIFVTDLMKTKNNIIFIPVTITVHPIESSGKKIYNETDALSDRSAIFVRCGGRYLGLLYIFIFWVKKFLLKKNAAELKK